MTDERNQFQRIWADMTGKTVRSTAIRYDVGEDDDHLVDEFDIAFTDGTTVTITQNFEEGELYAEVKND